MATTTKIEEVMDLMPYGLYVVGSSDGQGDADGMMADWLMQVSFSPRLLAVALERDARTLQNIKTTGVFSVNLLPQTDPGMALASKFAQPYYEAKIAGRAENPARIHHKLDNVAHTLSARGCPMLGDAMAWIECEVDQLIDTGDHVLAIGRVMEAQHTREAEPLTSTYTGWNYSG